MKKSVIFSFVLVIFLFASLSTVIAASNFSESEMVSSAYSCLNEKIDEKTCEAMTIDELIFSTMATGECAPTLRDAAETIDDEFKCWPNGGCDIKTTAQAMIALDIEDRESEKIIDWFNEKRMVPKDVDWFLEIDTENASSCTVSYAGSPHSTEILEDKKFTNAPGSCFDISDSGYWLKVRQSCFETEFEVSCDERFVTTLLFSEKGSSAIHVSRKVSVEPEGGVSREKISSFCFKEGLACDYEGTLWAITALGKLDYDLLPFMPYLITAEGSNGAFFPQPLLYMLTGYDNYKIDILDRQVAEEYWGSRAERYFNTALALLPFQGVEFTEKTNAIKWLSEIQDEDGCWNEGNIQDMGFLLGSIWPENWDSGEGGSSVSTPDNDCVRSGYYCDNVFDRGVSEVLGEYSCVGGSQKCYESPGEVETCSSVYPDADICNFNEICPTNKKVLNGETCCVGASCQLKESQESSDEENECEIAQGYCATSCSVGDIEESFYQDSCDAESYGDICCVPEPEKESSYLWLWILFAIIILMVIAIIYRDKIREQILKMKSNDKDESPSDERNRFRGPQGMQDMRQRRIIPNQQTQRPQSQRPQSQRPQTQRPQTQRPPQQMQRPQPQRPGQKSPEELNDVLRKLKDMSR